MKSRPSSDRCLAPRFGAREASWPMACRSRSFPLEVQQDFEQVLSKGFDIYVIHVGKHNHGAPAFRDQDN